MTRLYEIGNAEFLRWNLAQRNVTQRYTPDPTWIALWINVALAVAIAVIWTMVR
jgi:hypothetical protein